MKISIGPNLYLWEKQKTYDFYEKLASSQTDIIYLGETVCSKRRELSTNEWIQLAKNLKEMTNKEVVLSTLSLIESQTELGQLKRICANSEILVEANDLAAVDECIRLNVNFVTGPAVNIYNHKTLSFLYKKGLKRWVMPVELSGKSLKEMLMLFNEENPDNDLETEVFSWGMMPLAFSARCYSSRVKKLNKDTCNFNCIEDLDGIPVSSQENQTIFNINGIQTQSGQPINLLPYIDSLKDSGTDIIRITPHSAGVFEAISQLKNKLDNPEKELLFDTKNAVNGYWFDKAGFDWIKS